METTTTPAPARWGVLWEMGWGVPGGTPVIGGGLRQGLSMDIHYRRRDAAAPHDDGWDKWAGAGNPRNWDGMARNPCWPEAPSTAMGESGGTWVMLGASAGSQPLHGGTPSRFISVAAPHPSSLPTGSIPLHGSRDRGSCSGGWPVCLGPFSPLRPAPLLALPALPYPSGWSTRCGLDPI